MSSALYARADAASLRGLETQRAVAPAGVHAIDDLAERRATIDRLITANSAEVRPNPRIAVEERIIPGLAGGDPNIRVRLYRPGDVTEPAPAIYVIHGGGMVLGNLEWEHLTCLSLSDHLDAVVAQVDYRLAPEHPAPAALHDCYAGLQWLATESLGIDLDRLVIFGGSAGGGLALGTTLMARDHQGPRVAYQMLLYPMIDDRNATPSSREIVDLGVWDRAANVEAWSWYLGDAAGGDRVSPYLAPARMEDLSGSPPTFIDVGELDVFRDEDLQLAARLLRAGVPTELHVYPGAFHASESLSPESELSRRIERTRMDALRRAIHGVDTRGADGQ